MVKWQHQTLGVRCNQIFIEGLMIPLSRPKEWNEKSNKWIDYLDQLTNANYAYDDQEVDKLWKKINELLNFRYKEIEPPRGQPSTQEGIKWITVTSVKYPKRKDNTKIGRITYEGEFKTLNEQYKDLIGKKTALIYPNCD